MRRLFIGNLAFTATEEDIVSAFRSVNVNVAAAKVVRDRESKRSRGYGFADLADAHDNEVAAIIEKHQSLPIKERPVILDAAKGEPRKV